MKRGIGRTEVIVGVVVLLLIAAVATPLLLGNSNQSRRAEVAMYVEQIRAAELTIHEVFGEYESAEAAPRAPTEVDGNAVPWEASRGFNRLSWEPSDLDAVYGSYRVVLTDDGFTVIGTSDVDGDGKRAVYEATADTPATLTTPEDYY